MKKSIETDLEKLEKGLLNEKSLDEWNYNDLRKYAKDNFHPEEYREKIQKPKAELFEFLVRLKIKLLEEGTLISD